MMVNVTENIISSNFIHSYLQFHITTQVQTGSLTCMSVGNCNIHKIYKHTGNTFQNPLNNSTPIFADP